MPRKLVIAVAVLVVALLAVVLLVRRLVDPDVVRAAVEKQASAALGQPVKVGAVDWALSARPRVVLTNVEIGAPAAITLKRVEVATGLRALMSKRVEDAGLVITGSRVTLPLPFPLGGTTPAPSAPADAAAAGLTFVSVDRIALHEIDLVVGTAHLQLELESSLAGDRLAVSSFRLRSERTSIEGKGEVASLTGHRATFSATADPLDLDELLAIASGISGSGTSAAGVAGTPGPAAPLDLRFDLKAPRGRLLGIDFAGLSTTLAVTRERLTLQPFQVSLFDGDVSGQVEVGTKGEQPAVTASAKVANVDVAKVTAFAGSPGVITGRLAGQLDLRAAAGTPDVIFRTASGRAALAITDGTIPGLDLVGPVILAFGKPDAAKATEHSRRFSRLGGSFDLAEGVLRSDDLSMTSRDLDMKGRGTLRIAGAITDLKADLVLSDDLSSQAGRDLYRYAHEGSRIVLPATITGGLASPRVSIDIAAAAGRAIRNTLENELKKGLGRLLKP